MSQSPNQYFPLDSAPKVSKPPYAPSPRVNDSVLRPSSLVAFMRRPISTIFASRLTVLLIAVCATLTSIRDHAGLLSDAVSVGCIAKDYFPLPSGLSQFCGDDPTFSARLSLLSDRVEEVEKAIAELRATQRSPPFVPSRNFALRGGGATIDPSLTSPTYQLPPGTFRSRFLNWLRGYDLLDAYINLPIVILEDVVEVGEFWEFEGERGTVGIVLPEKIHVTSFSLNHVEPSKVSPLAMSCAPRVVSLWGYVDGDGIEAPIVDPSNRPVFGPKRPAPVINKPAGHFFPLGQAEYNAFGEYLHQNFRIADGLSHGISFRTIILEVSSNWGANMTCIYYVGIHGSSRGD